MRGRTASHVCCHDLVNDPGGISYVLCRKTPVEFAPRYDISDEVLKAIYGWSIVFQEPLTTKCSFAGSDKLERVRKDRCVWSKSVDEFGVGYGLRIDGGGADIAFAVGQRMPRREHSVRHHVVVYIMMMAARPACRDAGVNCTR
jgi:hypothetical protein